MLAQHVRKILLVLWALFVVFWIFAGFSVVAFVILLVASWVYRIMPRQLRSINCINSPMDCEVIKISADNDRKEFCVLLKSRPLGTGGLYAPRDCTSLGIVRNHNEISLKFEDVKLIIKQSTYSKVHLNENYYDLPRGFCFGFMLSGEILVSLPYESRLLVGLGDKLKAGDVLARIEE